MSRISGKDFDVMIGDLLVHVEAMSATISDNRKAVQSGGVPDGYVDGDVSCSGDIEMDAKNFNLVIEAAKAAGSFRELEPFDMVCIAKLSGEEQKVEQFGCLLMITDLLNVDQKGGEKSKQKIAYQVTSPDFVRINGVPYLSANDTRGL